MLEYSELVLGPFEILTNLGLDPLSSAVPMILTVRSQEGCPSRRQQTGQRARVQ